MRRRSRRPSNSRERTYSVDEHGWFYNEPVEGQPPSNFLSQMNDIPQVDVRQVIDRLMNMVGIKKGVQYYALDTSEMRRMIVEVGDPAKSSNIASLLNFGVTFNINVTDTSVEINGFKKKDDQWKDNTNGMIKVKDHVIGEPLVCPNCHTEYHNTNEVLLAQTMVHHQVYMAMPDSADCMRLMKPHIVLTPICPQCYCDKIDEVKEKINTINNSPVFVLPDQSRHIVPLVPKCVINKMTDSRNANSNAIPIVFWPGSDADILCSEIVNHAGTLKNDIEQK